MPLKTVALSAALTPTVISTWFSHYLHRRSLHSKPSIHLSYDEGIQVMREFLAVASKHPIEDLQEFSRRWVPTPHWVRTDPVIIPDEYLVSAAKTLIAQLGPKGVKKVGGTDWWQWRGPAEELKGEWIEMRNDYNERKKVGEEEYAGRNRIILYIHGGAYYFASVDTHRYQMQRHARKLRGRLFARLHDCLATYLWLLKQFEPKEIILAGDSAGGGLVLSILVTIRDQGLPLPAGGILISPWVDLTHSFPSIVADNPGDYIPPYGFRHKPSAAWPPPNADEILAMKKEARKATDKDNAEKALPKDSDAEDTAKKGYTRRRNGSHERAYPGHQEKQQDSEEEEPDNISVVVDGETVEIKDQIHMYTHNQLLSHPLVSPALQPSLGGLPPLLVVTGGGEMLRDEQIYLAHKAALPAAYPPCDVYLDEYDPNGEILNKYPPTCVQLQVWDDLCHVAPTLSFTRPAKFMFRSISQFGAWALARAQNLEVDILVDDDPPISSTESDNNDSYIYEGENGARSQPAVGIVGKAGDPLPSFQEHMIRQRVDKKGHVYPLDPPSSFPALTMPPSQVGAFNPVLVKRWLAAKQEWDEKFAKEKLRVQQQRIRELYHEFQNFGDEFPPPSSLAARRAAAALPPRRGQKSYLLTMWSGWASKHDERLIGKERHATKRGHPNKRSVVAGPAGASMTDPMDKVAESAPAEKTEDQENEQSGSTGPKSVTIDAEKADQTLAEERGKRSTGDLSVGSDSNHPGSSRTYNSSFDKPMSPLIVLPDYDNKKHKEENASTKALFHAPGTIPPSASDTSLAKFKSHRPASSRATSAAGFTDMDDANSTIADEKSLAVTGRSGAYDNIYDNASTRAVLHATGVVGKVGEDGGGVSSARQSMDTLSMSHRAASDGDLVSSLGVDNEKRNSMAGSRPGMPERDVFQTAEERKQS